MKHYSLQHSLRRIIAIVMMMASSILLSVQALAHPGHDHDAPQSMLIHVLFYGSIIVALALCAWVGYRFLKQRKDGNVDD